MICIVKTKYPDDYKTRLYRIWKGIINRTEKKWSCLYDNYGGRGISICKEWKNNFYVFKEWSLNNGYNDELTIDRINVNGNYEPFNCRWTTMKEQGNNRRDNVILTYNNIVKTIAEWAIYLGVNENTLRSRYKYGWTIEKIITTPFNNNDKVLIEYDGMTKTLREWSDYTGIKYSTLKGRYYNKWKIEEMLTVKDANKTIYLCFNNVSKSITEWSEYIGINRGTLMDRYYNGWTIEEMLTTPTNKRRK